MLGALTGDFEVGLGLGTGLSADAVAAGAHGHPQGLRRAGRAPAGPRPAQVRGPRDRRRLPLQEGGAAARRAREEPDADARRRRRQRRQARPRKQRAELHVDGEVATDAVLVALFRTDAPWAALRSHWYMPTGERHDDHQDRRDAHARARDRRQAGGQALRRDARRAPDELEFGKPNGFAVRPTALKVGREYFIRAPWKPLLEDGSILFANLLEEGSELELMRLGDMVGITRRFFRGAAPARDRTPRRRCCSTAVGACGTRALRARSTECRDLRSAPPAAGMNVHFEIYSGLPHQHDAHRPGVRIQLMIHRPLLKPKALLHASCCSDRNVRPSRSQIALRADRPAGAARARHHRRGAQRALGSPRALVVIGTEAAALALSAGAGACGRTPAPRPPFVVLAAQWSNEAWRRRCRPAPATTSPRSSWGGWGS